MLCRQLVRQGRFLFRWRGVLPLVLLPIALLASFQSGQFAHWFGEPVEEAWEVLCASFCLVGLAVRALTVGFAPAGRSGRATRAQRAERLNTTGLYSITRHPLYLGNFLVFLGFVLLTKVWWFPLPAILAFALSITSGSYSPRRRSWRRDLAKPTHAGRCGPLPSFPFALYGGTLTSASRSELCCAANMPASAPRWSD